MQKYSSEKFALNKENELRMLWIYKSSSITQKVNNDLICWLERKTKKCWVTMFVLFAVIVFD